MRQLRLLLPALSVIVSAALGPALAPRPAEQAVGIPFADPSADAWLGTDRLGRDVLSHLLYGGWGLLLLAAVIAVLVTAVSSVLGAIAALRPRVGAMIETATDFAMLVPAVLGILLVLTTWPDAGMYGLIVVAVLFGVPYCARVFAAGAAGVAASGYVEAARASGETLAHLVFREVLPNLREVLAAQLGLRFVAAVYLVSTASFLHLPTTLGASNWAVMVRDNASGMLLNPWSVLAPSLAIAIVAVSVNLAVTEFGRGTRGSAPVDAVSVRSGTDLEGGPDTGSGPAPSSMPGSVGAVANSSSEASARLTTAPTRLTAAPGDGVDGNGAHPAWDTSSSSESAAVAAHPGDVGCEAGSAASLSAAESSVLGGVGTDANSSAAVAARLSMTPRGGVEPPVIPASSNGARPARGAGIREPHPIVVVDGLLVRGPTGQELVGALSFRMPPGTITALTGPSGSGKTTVMRALLGQLPSGAIRAAGTVTVAGHEVFTLDSGALRRFRRTDITYVGQDPGSALNPLMRVRTLLAEVARDRSEPALLEAVHAVGLSVEHLRRRPGELSGGQQRRVALARALVRGTDVLVLDEPLAGLHGALRTEIGSLLVDLANRGTTILLSGHDTAAIHAIADQVIEVGTHPAASRSSLASTAPGPNAAAVFPSAGERTPEAPGHDTGDGGRSARAVVGPTDGGSATGTPQSPDGAPREDVAEKGNHADSSARDVGAAADRDDHGGGAFRYAVRAAADGEHRVSERPVSPAIDNPQPQIALRASGISATIGRHRALTDIDLALTAGSALAVVGASGAGKTTLARVIAGLRAAEGGALALAGTSIELGGKRRIGRGGDGIQLVPQNPMSALNPRRTVAQALDRPLRRIARVSKSAAPQRITELLDAVELPTALAARYPHELSGGQRQRVALARALAAEPSVLICDEITSALDHATAASIMALLDRIRAERGTAVLVITHDMALVAGHCAELVVLDHGRIVESGRTAEVLANPAEQATHDLLV
ncbi:ABC transporter ATP-binding protein/permease [Nocardia sp. bgisy118]|uniref:ABC transporter ATP-binding protein/permease n=1 Tax=Nocardia sp. bgisy118 TaxID=3413786 RepID=UPI003F49FF91